MVMERRSDVRLPISLPVRARFGRMLRNLTTLDVSRNGLFIVMDTPPTRGQLVHVTILLPTGGPPLPLRGMALHVVSGDAARARNVAAGAGMQFYGIGRASRQRWDEFFEEAHASHMAAGGVVHPPTPLGSKAPPRRAGDTLRPGEMPQTAEIVHPRAAGDPPEEAPTRRRRSMTAKGGPSPYSTSNRGDPQPGALVSTSAIQTPRGVLEPAHFRLCPPNVPAALRFREDALDSGGIVLVGAGSRSPGTPAVVSVVHPVTGAEFHVPGEVVRGGAERNAAVVQFFAVTDRTKEEFEVFAEQGSIPMPRGSIPPSPEPELSIYWSAEEAQWDLSNEPGGTVVIEEMLPLEAAVNPFVRRR